MLITESEITGPIARTLREGLGLTQPAFWNPVGVKQSVGCRYEVDTPIPASVRILLVARYVAGLTIDATTAEGVADLQQLALVQAKVRSAKSIASSVKSDLNKTIKKLEAARDALQSL